MARCIELARQAEGRTSPNPMVGAVVVDDQGRIIAEGFHQKAGEPHAEVIALDQAGDTARGATLFVSLEPCCHHGKTPPCSDRVIKSGVKRVVCAMVDPNPKVGGGGVQALKNAGIDVVTGILESEATYLNRAFLKSIKSGLPWVAIKMAVTIDGKIADRSRASRWITGEEARRFVHELRNAHDALMIGGATAQHDDAQLTVRDIRDGRNPMRVILDTQLQLSPSSAVASNEDGLTHIFASAGSIQKRQSEFASTRTSLIPIATKNEHLDIQEVLAYLGRSRVLSVLCEGGGRLASNLLPYADELYWMIAPKIMNDEAAVPALSGGESSDVSSLHKWKLREFRRLGEDVLLHYVR